jgi:hypothetical protein
MNILSQENPYDMRVKSLTFCLSDMNNLDRVKNSEILRLIQPTYDNRIFDNASVDLLKTFIEELCKSLDGDSILLKNIIGIYESKLKLGY